MARKREGTWACALVPVVIAFVTSAIPRIIFNINFLIRRDIEKVLHELSILFFAACATFNQSIHLVLNLDTAVRKLLRWKISDTKNFRVVRESVKEMNRDSDYGKEGARNNVIDWKSATEIFVRRTYNAFWVISLS